MNSLDYEALMRRLCWEVPKRWAAFKISAAIFFMSFFVNGLAQATIYTLPANIGSAPFASCSIPASGTTYNCTGNLTFNGGDTINVTSPMTLNLTNGSLSIGTNFTINSGGSNFTISALVGSINIQPNFLGSVVNMTAGGTINIGSNATITGNLTASALTLGNNTVVTGTCKPSNTKCTAAVTNLHHIRLNHSGFGVTCTGSSVTVNACSGPDAGGACTADTSGLAGNVVAGAVTVPFTIAAGSSSATVTIRVTTPQTVTLATSGLSVTPTGTTTCWNGSAASCSHTYSDSGFIFDVPHHVSEVLQTVNVSAVKKSDSSLACAPAFGVPKIVNFRCSYGNPATGTLPVRVNGGVLNAANNPAAACDAVGRAVSVSFNASGVASTTFQYADVGNMALTATYTGSGSDAGLSMVGNDTFIAAPKDFAFSSITPASIKAGNNFSATITARNNADNATPNFGKETAPEGVNLSFAKYQPTGAGAVSGSFSGTVSAFNSGAATGTNLYWSEVGTIDLTATLASGTSPGYLGSGITPAAKGTTGTTGAVGPFIPDHFVTTVTEGCAGCGFTYSGQPFTVKVTANNGLATPTPTVNYDGTANTTPNFANNVALTDANAMASPLGVLGVSAAPMGVTAVAVIPATTPPSTTLTIPKTDFAQGTTTLTAVPTYTFNTVLIAPKTVKIRALDVVNSLVTSSGFTEGTMEIRSGRIRIPNVYGSELLPLPLVMTVQYYNGSNWLTSLTDSVTSFDSHLSTATPPGNLIASGIIGLGGFVTVSNPVTSAVVAGVRTVTLAAPNVSGYADISLSAPNYLLAGSNVAGINPSKPARATFGIYNKSLLIYRRENY